MQASVVRRFVPIWRRNGWASLKSLAVKEGDLLPERVVFKTRSDNQWLDVSTDDVFKGKRVALFGLPGAFTPTCSSTHLPRYSELAPELKKNGIDKIVCVSVNDAFVCNAWIKDLKAKDVMILPDGNTTFTKSIGALVDKSSIGFGLRSWRYSMVVNDGKVEKVFCEPDQEGDPFEVSDADTMLAYLKGKQSKA
uniref:Thioredoxin domain-containing protein n=1 Tax=Spongospora subterranea TaxID=70186 RepID=A0A0H5R541_9EUKA|eukprot:CRZ08917.1 hypothetical protein [Spongospora subterranea]